MKKFLLIPVICLTFVSCNGNSNSDYVRITQSEKQTSPADWKITLDVKQAILLDGSLDAGNRFVSISTTNGVVTVSGSVSTRDQMNRLLRTIENVDGVVEVDNQLTMDSN